MDGGKCCWSGGLVQYHEQKQEDGTTLSILHTITYQNGTFQSSQKNWTTLTKEAYVIYMSSRKMVFCLKDAHVMI